MAAPEESTRETLFNWLTFPRWKMFLSPKSSVGILFGLGVIFLSVGAVFFTMTYKLDEYEFRYDDRCPTESTCTISIHIPKKLKGNIAFLYKLRGFYQNHRQVMKSRSFDQLGGKYLEYSELDSCYPAVSLDKSKNLSKLNVPCGLMAMSFFNDTYIWKNTSLSFSEHNISLRSDRNKIYKPLSSEYTTGNRWLASYESFPGETTNEHFIIWMRTAAMPTFQKLYSRCVDCELDPGYYQIEIKTSYPRKMFKGKRSIVVAEIGSIGSGSLFLAITYISVGGLSFIASIAFLLQMMFCPRTFGDLSPIWTALVQNEKPRTPYGSRVSSMLTSS